MQNTENTIAKYAVDANLFRPRRFYGGPFRIKITETDDRIWPLNRLQNTAKCVVSWIRLEILVNLSADSSRSQDPGGPRVWEVVGKTTASHSPPTLSITTPSPPSQTYLTVPPLHLTPTSRDTFFLTKEEAHLLIALIKPRHRVSCYVLNANY